MTAPTRAAGVGVYYEHGGVTIIHADCRAVMAEMPDASVDLVLCDPPYGVGMKYGDSYQDVGGDEYWAWFKPCVAEMRRVGLVVAFTHRTLALRELTDWDWVATWNKPWSGGARIGNSPVLPHWEPIFLYGIHRIGVKAGNHRSDIYVANPVNSHARNGEISPRLRAQAGTGAAAGFHPCPKPEKLFRDLVATFSPEGGTVFDPFMGSGTTLRAAKDLGRTAIGVDCEEAYCAIAAKRMAQEVLL